MSRLTPEIRWATAADLDRFYGERVPMTVRARVAELEGEIIAVFGWRMVGGRALVFSELSEAARRFPMSIVRETRKLMSELGSVPAICIADPGEPTAAKFLRVLGWQHGHSSDEGEVYKWPN